MWLQQKLGLTSCPPIHWLYNLAWDTLPFWISVMYVYTQENNVCPLKREQENFKQDYLPDLSADFHNCGNLWLWTQWHEKALHWRWVQWFPEWALMLVLTRTTWTRSVWADIPVLFLIIGKHIQYFNIKDDVSYRVFKDALYQMRKHLSTLILFAKNGCWILSRFLVYG
jgi:hypothetical protein